MKAARRSWLICAPPSLVVMVACHIEDASPRIDGSRSEIQLSKSSGMGWEPVLSHEREQREASGGTKHTLGGWHAALQMFPCPTDPLQTLQPTQGGGVRPG